MSIWIHQRHGLAADDLSNGAIVEINGEMFDLNHGVVLIAAITSSTNTSNPGLMMASMVRTSSSQDDIE